MRGFLRPPSGSQLGLGHTGLNVGDAVGDGVPGEGGFHGDATLRPIQRAHSQLVNKGANPPTHGIVVGINLQSVHLVPDIFIWAAVFGDNDRLAGAPRFQYYDAERFVAAEHTDYVAGFVELRQLSTAILSYFLGKALASDLLVMDETSMVDVPLMHCTACMPCYCVHTMHWSDEPETELGIPQLGARLLKDPRGNLPLDVFARYVTKQTGVLLQSARSQMAHNKAHVKKQVDMERARIDLQEHQATCSRLGADNPFRT
jgi:hypothetical protein